MLVIPVMQQELVVILDSSFHPITHAGLDQKVEMYKQCGTDVVINYKTQDFAVEVLSVTADRGIYLSIS